MPHIVGTRRPVGAIKFGIPLPGALGVPTPPADIVYPPPPITGLKLLLDASNAAFRDLNTIGYNSFGFIEDLMQLGGGFGAFNKDAQPIVGPNGGPVSDVAGHKISQVVSSLLAGASKFSIYLRVRPISALYSGTTSRTIFSITEANTAVAALATAIATPGTLYAAGDYVTFPSSLYVKVLTVDGGGGVLTYQVISYGSFTATPTNPVSQTQSRRPPNGSTTIGTGFQLNLTMPPIGSGSSGTRFQLSMSGGTSGRKLFVTVTANDGAPLATSTSLGPQLANDTDTIVGIEVDFTASPVPILFYINGSLAYSTSVAPAETAPWSFPPTAPLAVTLGDGVAGLNPSVCEVLRVAAKDDLLSSGDRAALQTWMAA